MRRIVFPYFRLLFVFVRCVWVIFAGHFVRTLVQGAYLFQKHTDSTHIPPFLQAQTAVIETALKFPRPQPTLKRALSGWDLK